MQATDKKILTLDELSAKSKECRDSGKKVVLCHGVFDLVHLGHIEHFKSAKSYGDYLIVSLTLDKFIKKGPGRPLFNEQQRMEYLKQIKIVDQVILSKTESSIDIINTIKPDFYVKGPDYKENYKDKTKKIILEKKAVEKNGGKIRFTNDITFSSSNILNTSNLIFDDKCIENSLQEEKRLFYVAITRAKDQLYFVSDEINESNFFKDVSKDWVPIEFDELLINKVPLEVTKKRG